MGEAVGVLRLDGEVELGLDRDLELPNETAWRVDARLGDGRLEELGEPVEEVDIALDGVLDARALDLDDDGEGRCVVLFFDSEFSAIDLGDGGAGEGLIGEG